MQRTGTIRSGGASSGTTGEARADRRHAQIRGIAPVLRTLIAQAAGPTLGGLMLGASLLGLPLSTTHLAQFEALNRELGKLCSKPPPQALNVCRLHARLVSGL